MNDKKPFNEGIANIEADIARIDRIIDQLNQVWIGSNDDDLLAATRSLGALHFRLQRKLVEAKYFRDSEIQKS